MNTNFETEIIKYGYNKMYDTNAKLTQNQAEDKPYYAYSKWWIYNMYFEIRINAELNKEHRQHWR